MTFTQLISPEGLIHQIFTEDSFVQEAGLGSAGTLEMNKRASSLPEAYNLVKISDLRDRLSVGTEDRRMVEAVLGNHGC